MLGRDGPFTAGVMMSGRGTSQTPPVWSSLAVPGKVPDVVVGGVGVGVASLIIERNMTSALNTKITSLFISCTCGGFKWHLAVSLVLAQWG